MCNNIIRPRIIALSLWFVASIVAMMSIIASFIAALAAPGSKYHHNLLVGHDQDGNAMIGGDPDETISSVLGKHRDSCAACEWICRILNDIDPRHCKNSIENDEGKDAVIK